MFVPRRRRDVHIFIQNKQSDTNTNETYLEKVKCIARERKKSRARGAGGRAKTVIARRMCNWPHWRGGDVKGRHRYFDKDCSLHVCFFFYIDFHCPYY